VDIVLGRQHRRKASTRTRGLALDVRKTEAHSPGDRAGKMSHDETRFCEIRRARRSHQTDPKTLSFRSAARNLLLAASGSAAGRRADSSPAKARLGMTKAGLVGLDLSGGIGPAGVGFCDEALQPTEHALPTVSMGFGLVEIASKAFLRDAYQCART
jgi:hypothetical protein